MQGQTIKSTLMKSIKVSLKIQKSFMFIVFCVLTIRQVLYRIEFIEFASNDRLPFRMRPVVENIA